MDKNERQRLQLISKGVPSRIAGSSEEDISPSIWKQVTDGKAQGGLFITGPTGVGKSYLLAALMKHWGVHNSWWISVPDLMVKIRDTFSHRDSTQTEASLIEEFSSVPLLFLDDMGTENTSQYTIQTLYVILDRRYGNERPTYITSNVTLDEISAVYSERISSRIRGMCKVVNIKGKDKRGTE